MSEAPSNNTPLYSRTRRILWVAAVVIVLVAADHATKWLAIEFLKGRAPLIYLGDIFRLQYATNTGAFLSLGAGLPDAVRPYVLTGLNGLILLGVALFLIVKRHISTAVALALTLILAGGIGNMIDRIFRDGVVVDFMNLGIPWGPFPVRTGIFNIADIAIMGGLFLMIWIELFLRPKEEKAAMEAKAAREGSGQEALGTKK
jgi:signal peptidase II